MPIAKSQNETILFVSPDYAAMAETKPHTRDPKPTTLDPNDPKAKQTHIPKSESFEEYMKRRAAEGKK